MNARAGSRLGHPGAGLTRPSMRGAALLLALLLILALALVITVASGVHNGLLHLNLPPVSVVIDGEEVFSGLDFGSLPAGEVAGWVGCITLLVLVAVVVLPLTLLGLLALLLMVVMVALGLPLLAVGAVALLVFSPLLLLGLLLWWLLKPSRKAQALPGASPHAGPSATIKP